MFYYGKSTPKVMINPRKLTFKEKAYGLVFKKKLMAKLRKEALSLGLKGMHNDAYVKLTLEG